MNKVRYEVVTQASEMLDNGPDEKWIVICGAHGAFLGFRTKRDAEQYRAYLNDARRSLRRGHALSVMLHEFCETCAADADPSAETER